jgi:cytochrome c-type biogenesis protein CcmF
MESHQDSWCKLGRIAFGVHGACVIGIFVVLYIIIQGHYFEYQYAYAHSSLDLPANYLLSCFWEGQEGSFMLWAFWHVVLGMVLMQTSGKWESPTMFVMAMIQLVIMTMVMGLYLFGGKIGSSPFLLLRETMDAPIFQRADYLQFITDGNGLNPLLQNYWMVIHPPVLFLGFASVAVPFAFVIAGLWRGDFKSMTVKALPWALFAMAALGTGILMGGAWAYESLSFGGFWAWDPVENASLVPWLTLVAGVHTLVIFRHTGHALVATCIFLVVTFLLVLYSTFLTRSGVLGDTSVHAFTDLGMFWQLIIFIVIFLLLAVVFFVAGRKKLPVVTKEEPILSREFWMFIGSLVLVVAGVQIIHDTSWPFINKLVNETMLGNQIRSLPMIGDFYSGERVIVEPVEWYNDIQIWVAIILALITGFAQWLRYKSTASRKHLWTLAISAIGSILLSGLLSWLFAIPIIEPLQREGGDTVGVLSKYWLLLAAAVFSITTNLVYLVATLKVNWRMWGSPVSHTGFAIMLIGILVSSYNKQVISINTQGIDYGNEIDEQNKRENILLRKNIPVAMGEYIVTYEGDSTDEPNVYYRVRYERIDDAGEVAETFVLHPYAQFNPEMGIIANPSTRHYLTHDVFTHVFSVPDKSAMPDTMQYEKYTMEPGDTIFTKSSFVVLNQLIADVPIVAPPSSDLELTVGAELHVYTMDGRVQTTMPVYYVIDYTVHTQDSHLEDPEMYFRLASINPEERNVTIEILEPSPTDDFIIMKAIIFPGINLVWLGSLVMVGGILLSAFRRLMESRRNLRS